MLLNYQGGGVPSTECNQNPRRKRAAYLCVRQSLIALGSSLDYHGGLVQERAGVVQVRAEDQGHQDHPEDAAQRALSRTEALSLALSWI